MNEVGLDSLQTVTFLFKLEEAFDIEIDFVAQEPPEAVLRLLDEFIHRMTPVPVKEKNHE